nr:NAD(P)-binding oxidoreductase [Nonomuraea sp. 3-1Str]
MVRDPARLAPIRSPPDRAPGGRHEPGRPPSGRRGTGRGGVRARAAGARAHHDLRRRTISIVRATAAEGARRLVVVTANGMITEGDGPVTRLVFKPVLGRVPRNPFADMLRMEDVVRASGLDWTIVRPPPLTEGPRTGSYRSAIDRVRGASGCRGPTWPTACSAVWTSKGRSTRPWR